MIIQSTQKNKRTVQGEGGLSPSTGIEVTPVSVRACALESFGLLLALRFQSPSSLPFNSKECLSRAKHGRGQEDQVPARARGRPNRGYAEQLTWGVLRW